MTAAQGSTHPQAGTATQGRLCSEQHRRLGSSQRVQAASRPRRTACRQCETACARREIDVQDITSCQKFPAWRAIRQTCRSGVGWANDRMAERQAVHLSLRANVHSFVQTSRTLDVQPTGSCARPCSKISKSTEKHKRSRVVSSHTLHDCHTGAATLIILVSPMLSWRAAALNVKACSGQLTHMRHQSPPHQLGRS